MRSFAAVLLLIVILSTVCAPVQAKTSDWLKLAIALGVIAVAGGNGGTRQQSPAAEQAEPLLRSQRSLESLLIREVSGSSNTRWVAGEVLSAAGWQVIYDEDRRSALDEQRYGGRGQVAAAGFFASVRSEFRQGREYDRGQYGRSYSSGNGGREVVCTVYLRIADGTGRTLQGTGSGSSWSRYDRFDWRSRRYGSTSRDYAPNDQDLALLSAMVAASNQVIRQLSPPSGSTVPKGSVGDAGTPVGYCPSCGGQIPSGANFCPKCGKELPH